MNGGFIVIAAGLWNAVLIILLIVTPIGSSRPRPWYHIEGVRPAAILDPAQAAVLPPAAGRVRGECSIGLPHFRTGFWAPDSELTKQIEEDLARFLPFAEELRPTASEVERPPLSRYYRQYLGVVLIGGERLVLVNAFLTMDSLWGARPEWFWRSYVVDVCDGGAGFWHLEYDPARRLFRRFRYNGFA